MKRETAPPASAGLAQNRLKQIREKLNRPLALAAMVGALAVPAARASESEPVQPAIEPLPEFIVGAQEDSVLTEDEQEAERIADLINEAGFNTLKVTMPWTYPRQCAEIDNDLKRFQTAVAAAREHNLIFMLNPIPGGGAGLGKAPITPSQRRCFVDTNISYAHAFEEIWPNGHLILEWPNEPNSENFWRPQRNKDGEWIAPKDVTSLLIAGYKKMKEEAEKLDIGITIIGGGLASKHYPLDFLAGMGKAKKESGVKGDMMDAVSLHPYGESNDEPPDKVHSDSPTIGLGDLPKLVVALDNSFIKQDFSILLSEYGSKTKVPKDKSQHYESLPASADLVTESQQASYYTKAIRMARCQSRIGGLVLFNVIDDEDGFWTSGIMYPGGLPKSSYNAIRQSIIEAQNNQTRC